MKRAFLFAGQGAQYAGMGKEICEKYPEAEAIFDIATKALNMDMKKLCFLGPDEELMKTENTQPAILTVNTAIASVIKSQGITADVTAGLSLGEYAALVEAEGLKFEDAVKIVRKRGKFMQEAVPLGVGAMAAIIGLERDVVNDIIKTSSIKGVVEGANYNYPGQIVVSGEKAAVEEACRLTQEKGGKAVVLPVSAPFHCSMLEGAGEKLSKELNEVETFKLNIPVISNVTADYYQEGKIKDLLVKQVSNSVFWEDSIMKMLDNGVEIFIEIGPGKALTGFVKKIARKIKKDVQCFNVEDIKSLEALLEGIK